jgi:hypothetical protein
MDTNNSKRDLRPLSQLCCVSLAASVKCSAVGLAECSRDKAVRILPHFIPHLPTRETLRPSQG